MHQSDGYDRTFDWIINNKRHYNFCISKKDLSNIIKMLVQMKVDYFFQKMVLNHKNFNFRCEAVKPDRSLYLGTDLSSKKQWFISQLIH
jgi:hypothetical protein